MLLRSLSGSLELGRRAVCFSSNSLCSSWIVSSDLAKAFFSCRITEVSFIKGILLLEIWVLQLFPEHILVIIHELEA